MMNPDFDPLDILMQQQHKTNQLDQNVKQLVIAYNSRNDLLDQIVENLQILNNKVNDLEARVQRQEAEITQLHIGRNFR